MTKETKTKKRQGNITAMNDDDMAIKTKHDNDNGIRTINESSTRSKTYIK